jgi:hypothetical protein
MRTKTKQLALVLIALTGLAGVYTYAQHVIIQKKSTNSVTDQKTSVAQEEEAYSPGLPTGDDPWKEMDKLVTAYYDKQGVVYKGLIRLIDDNQETEKVLEEHTFEYTSFKESFRYLMDSIEVINQKGYILFADHRSKLVSLSENQEDASSRLFNMEEFQKLMQEQHVHAEVTQSGGEKILTIDSIQHPQIQGYQIYYDPATYQISKMLIGMLRFSPLDDEDNIEADDAGIFSSEDPTGNGEIETYTYYVEINYKKSEQLQNQMIMSINRFLQIDANQVSLQPGFSNYQLINLTDMEQAE